MAFSTLKMKYVGPGKWKLVWPLFWRKGTTDEIKVPSGFETDLDSVPRVPVVYAGFKGRATKSAVLHDYLCEKPGFPRKKADQIFLDAMKDEGVPWRHRWPVYLAVRGYGLATFKDGAWF